MKIAVILFAYDRIKYLRRALKSHRELPGLDYYCFIDCSPKQTEVYYVVNLFPHWKITPRVVHLGLDYNITQGITEVFDMGYDAVIVLEDDLELSEDAFFYLVSNLIIFKDDPHCGSVSLHKEKMYCPDFKCWGWGTWKDRWDRHFYEDGKGTQATQFAQFHWDNQLYCRCSPVKRVKHFGRTGVHYKWYSGIGFRPLYRWLKTKFRRGF